MFCDFGYICGLGPVRPVSPVVRSATHGLISQLTTFPAVLAPWGLSYLCCLVNQGGGFSALEWALGLIDIVGQGPRLHVDKRAQGLTNCPRFWESEENALHHVGLPFENSSACAALGANQAYNVRLPQALDCVTPTRASTFEL